MVLKLLGVKPRLINTLEVEFDIFIVCDSNDSLAGPEQFESGVYNDVL